MDVVLVNPPAEAPLEPEIASASYGLANMPPLGLLYLAASLKASGYQVKIVDCNARLHLGRNVDETARMVAAEKPSVIGISATSPQLRGAVQLARALKFTLEEGVPIVLGGVHITSDPGFIKAFPEFDACLTGEGEISFPQLVDKFLGGEKLKGEYPGVTPQNLDLLPFPARELVNKSDYFEPGKEFANISTVRGCPYRCIFCSVPAVKGWELRFRSAANVVDEMEEIGKEYDWHFYLVDDVATVSRRHMADLCAEILRRNIDAVWALQTRVDLVDRRLLLSMYEAGCRYINFGIESGSQRIRFEVVGKKFSDEEVFKVFRLCREIGIATLCSLMIGFPSETVEDVEKTVQLAKKIPADAVDISITEIFPATTLFKLAVENKLIDSTVYAKVASGEVSPPVYYIPEGMSLSRLLNYRKAALR